MKSSSIPPFVSRRSVLSLSALTVGASFLGLRNLSLAENGTGAMKSFDRYGPLVPDPEKIIDLPKGFRYRVLSRTGDKMSDGLLVPGYPDGMGAFRMEDGQVALVRNHELQSKGADGKAEKYRELGPFGETNENFAKVDSGMLYDSGAGGKFPSLGGTSTLIFDPEKAAVTGEYLSLAGTERNCAGGITPWGTWLTCEESNEVGKGEFLEDHGYAFEVTPTAEQRLQKAQALKSMGRFRREAVAVDPATGIVYQTEDMGDGLFYRFIPEVPGDLSKGGKVQALALVDRDGADTRNWNDSEGPKMPVGKALAARWIDMDDVQSPKDDLRHRGHAAGAALFARSEGIWHGDGSLYFACTNGGEKALGQIFRYVPEVGAQGAESGGEIELFVESTDDKVVQNADNLTIAPWGDIIVCEDRSEDSHLRGVTPDGRIYTFGFNRISGTEFAGACFAPDLDTMFVNIQKPGLTLAIDGPWREGSEA